MDAITDARFMPCGFKTIIDSDRAEVSCSTGDEASTQMAYRREVGRLTRGVCLLRSLLLSVVSPLAYYLS
jgi:hypothetical protein